MSLRQDSRAKNLSFCFFGNTGRITMGIKFMAYILYDCDHAYGHLLRFTDHILFHVQHICKPLIQNQ